MSLILNKLKKEAIIYCPLCNKEYKPTNMRIIDQVGDTIFAHSNCPHCGGAILSLLYHDLIGVTLVGMVTDLDYQDALKAKSAGTVNEDEVIELYQRLST